MRPITTPPSSPSTITSKEVIVTRVLKAAPNPVNEGTQSSQASLAVNGAMTSPRKKMILSQLTRLRVIILMKRPYVRLGRENVMIAIMKIVMVLA